MVALTPSPVGRRLRDTTKAARRKCANTTAGPTPKDQSLQRASQPSQNGGCVPRQRCLPSERMDQMASSLEISNLAERVALRKALWRAATHVLGDKFDDVVYDAQDSPGGEEEVDRRVSAFLAVRAALNELSKAEDGAGPMTFTWTTDLAGRRSHK